VSWLAWHESLYGRIAAHGEDPGTSATEAELRCDDAILFAEIQDDRWGRAAGHRPQSHAQTRWKEIGAGQTTGPSVGAQWSQPSELAPYVSRCHRWWARAQHGAGPNCLPQPN
jgi:hypothetical protein